MSTQRFLHNICSLVKNSWISLFCKHRWVSGNTISIQPHPEYGRIAIKTIWCMCQKCSKINRIRYKIFIRDESKVAKM